MNRKSAKISISFSCFLLLATAIANLSAASDIKILSIFGIAISFVYFAFFYAVGGIYHTAYLIEYNPPIFMARIEEWLITPLFYGALAYLIDRFILIRFTEKTWLRVLLLLVIFAGMSIPVLILYPPLATF